MLCSCDRVIGPDVGRAAATWTPCARADDMIGDVEDEEGNDGDDPEEADDVAEEVPAEGLRL